MRLNELINNQPTAQDNYLHSVNSLDPSNQLVSTQFIW